MRIHANAALTPRQRRRLCQLADRVSITVAAGRVGCSRQTASKWVNRGRRGEPMTDRSSRPHHSPRQTSASVEQVVLRARRELEAGPHVIGWATGLAASTVYRILVRHGCQHLQPPPRREEIIRYERERPGELLHIDCKKLGRILQPGHRVTGDRSTRAKGMAGFHCWAYARTYPTESDRANALPDALDTYNRYRPHRALGGLTPLQRVNNLTETNS